MSTAKKLRVWWRFQRRRDKAAHDQVPCWKQYVTLFLGSIAVGSCTIASTALMSITDPLVDYFAVFSFGIAVPTSLVLHYVGRTVIRMLRRRLALSRGRSVEGTISKKLARQMRKRSLGGDEEAGFASTVDPNGRLSVNLAAPGSLNRSQSAHFTLEASVSPEVRARMSALGETSISSGVEEASVIDVAQSPASEEQTAAQAKPRGKKAREADAKAREEANEAARQAALGRAGNILEQKQRRASLQIGSGGAGPSNETQFV